MCADLLIHLMHIKVMIELKLYLFIIYSIVY